MNEAHTRLHNIDPLLAASGWGVNMGTRIAVEHPITLGRVEADGRPRNALRADYLLLMRGRQLAVVEAKAAYLYLTEGLAQAKNYATKLGVRFAFASNGKGFYCVDMETGEEGPVDRFPTPDELWARTFPQADPWRDRFAAVPTEDRGGTHLNRYYQTIAIDRVLDGIAAGRRRLLLTLATGTGKTNVAFQIVWKLFHARWSLDANRMRRPRVLFLADRNILADQAYNAFSAFADDVRVRIRPEELNRSGSIATNGSIFFAIFQTLVGDDRAGSGTSRWIDNYDHDFFDLIIVDECHRGGANDQSEWRDILEHFSGAVQLGLTATPKRKDNVDTYAYFGEPVFIYSLKEGIQDGFLTPFRIRHMTTSLDDYAYDPNDSVVEGEVEEERIYIEGDFNRIIVIPEREAKRVDLFMEAIAPDEKTLIFCSSQEHAAMVRDLVNQRKKSRDPDYCHRVTANDGKLGDQHLRNFQNNERLSPIMLTTSQKLSTGVDARGVRNIVLMRPVRSMIEFKQILGRGTRLLDGKRYFTVYDFVKASDHFADPEWDGEPAAPDPCATCGQAPCICVRPERRCATCGASPCICEEEACPTCGELPCTCEQGRRRVRIHLAPGRALQISHAATTSYWGANGEPVTAQQLVKELFGALPHFFRSEEELRTVWSLPATRAELLARLAEAGYPAEQLGHVVELLGAEQSDIFDVLSQLAFDTRPLLRSDRAAQALARLPNTIPEQQQAFITFVIDQYVREGVYELESSKLSALLKLRYQGAISDGVRELGGTEAIREAFTNFQRDLYTPGAA